MLRELLQHYPNREAADYLISGFTAGFPLHICETRQLVLECSQYIPSNYSSVMDNPTVVLEKICKELHSGRIEGPFDTPPAGIKFSPLALIQSKSDSNKFRLVHDLSFPRDGTSVNEHIPDEKANVQYTKFDHVINHIAQMDSTVKLAIIDIKGAFRLLPVKVSEHKYLGFSFQDKYYVDKNLPQGCRSSCQTFEVFSTFVEYIIRKTANTDGIFHYLDDYALVAEGDECDRVYQIFMDIADKLGIPIALEKLQGPSDSVTFLGLQIQAKNKLVQVPSLKVTHCTQKIQDILLNKSVSKLQLQSVIGLLSFICRAIFPGRAHLRRLINLMATLDKPHYKIRLSGGVREDLHMWLLFLQKFNGNPIVPIIDYDGNPSPELLVYASLSGGVFIYCHPSWCLSTYWPQTVFHFKFPGITLRLFACLIGLHICRDHLRDSMVLIKTDSDSTCVVLNSQTSKHKEIMFFVRRITLTCLRYNIRYKAVFSDICSSGDTCNMLLDSMYRSWLQVLAQGASFYPSQVTPRMWKYLSEKEID